MIVQNASGVPDEHEDYEGRKDAEQLDEAVEEKVAVQAARVQAEDDGRPE